MILKLFNFDSVLNGTAIIQKTTAIQILFTRLSDTYHCGDLLRVLDRPRQIILNRRIGYHNTILTSMRPDFSHLHGLYFRLRLGVEDEHLVSSCLFWSSDSLVFSPLLSLLGFEFTV